MLVSLFDNQQGDDPKAEDIQKFYEDSRIPLVGQMTSYDQQKKYTKRPLCVVYYDVDFSFEQRTGLCFLCLCIHNADTSIWCSVYLVGVNNNLEENLH